MSDLREELEYDAYHEHMMGTFDISASFQMFFVGLSAVVIGVFVSPFHIVLGLLLVLWGLAQAGQYRATVNDGRLIYEER